MPHKLHVTFINCTKYYLLFTLSYKNKCATVVYIDIMYIVFAAIKTKSWDCIIAILYRGRLLIN